MREQKQPDERPVQRREIDLAQMYPVIQEVLAAGGSFTLTITGTSMYPTLLGQRDRVTLSSAPERLKKLDLPLYRRKDGSFILHRIVSVSKDGVYTCCGDHQWVKELGVEHSRIVGLVTQIERKGKCFSVDSRKYRFWVRLWYLLMPFRRALFFVVGLPRRLGRKLRKQKNRR